MRRFLALVLVCICLNSCATQSTLTKEAEKWQRTEARWDWTAQVAENPDMAAWKVRISRDGWNDKTVEALIEYLHDLMSYSLMGPCGNPFYICSPKNFQDHNYRGLCGSLGFYIYHVFKYLDYPRGVRLGFVNAFGLAHVVCRIQMEDSTWKMFNSYTALGLQKLDEIFYIKVIDFDDKGVY